MTNVKGNVTLDAEYPGCPYCGEKRHIICTSCNKFFCYHGQEYVTCPNCGASGNVVSVEQVDLKGWRLLKKNGGGKKEKKRKEKKKKKEEEKELNIREWQI